MNKDFGKVAVLFGGKSAERAVSLNSGSRVLAALQHQGVDAHAFDPAERSLDELKGFDRAFIALHGRFGEDGTIQGALELMGIPYTGSGVLASALGMDKWRTKLGPQSPQTAVRNDRLGQRSCQGACLGGGQRADHDVAHGLGFSGAIEQAERSEGGLQAAYAAAAEHDKLVLVEQGITGGEYTVAIIGQGDDMRALPIIKIEPANEFYDYEAKYLRDDTRYLCPCGLSAEKEAEIQAGALKAFRAIGGRGWGRVDFLMDEAGNHYYLEVNTSPGMTDHSLVPMAARVAGMDSEQLVLRVLALATLG